MKNFIKKIFSSDETSELQEKILEELDLQMEALQNNHIVNTSDDLVVETNNDNEEIYILDVEEPEDEEEDNTSETEENSGIDDLSFSDEESETDNEVISGDDIMAQRLQRLYDWNNDLEGRINELKEQEAELKRKLKME